MFRFGSVSVIIAEHLYIYTSYSKNRFINLHIAIPALITGRMSFLAFSTINSTGWLAIEIDSAC